MPVKRMPTAKTVAKATDVRATEYGAKGVVADNMPAVSVDEDVPPCATGTQFVGAGACAVGGGGVEGVATALSIGLAMPEDAPLLTLRFSACDAASCCFSNAFSCTNLLKPW
jgi:hypothetical protein